MDILALNSPSFEDALGLDFLLLHESVHAGSPAQPVPQQNIKSAQMNPQKPVESPNQKMQKLSNRNNGSIACPASIKNVWLLSEMSHFLL